jgi:hypothetical protein
MMNDHMTNEQSMSLAFETRAANMVDPAFRITVERLLQAQGQAQGRPAQIAGLALKRSPFATLFPADVLSISLDNGETITLFVKYLGSEQSDHPDKQCRDREVRVYEQLFPSAECWVLGAGWAVDTQPGAQRRLASTQHYFFGRLINLYRSTR